MIKDLEPMLPQLCAEGNFDAESAIMQFAHGDCHYLTWALHEKYGAKMVAIFGEKSGIPVHSCVLIDDNTTLDGYGINTLEATVKRYSKLSMINLKEPAISRSIDGEWFNTFGGQLDEEPDDILVDFQPIIELLEVDLKKLLNA